MIINVLEYLEETAAKYPDKAAFVDEKKALSFGEMLRNAKAVGSYISIKGKLHSPVVVFMEKSADNIAAFMGVLYSGNFYCPIDTEMPLSRIQVIMDTLKPAAILLDKESIGRLEGLEYSGSIMKRRSVREWTRND